jgi:hypothetical protein
LRLAERNRASGNEEAGEEFHTVQMTMQPNLAGAYS